MWLMVWLMRLREREGSACTGFRSGKTLTAGPGVGRRSKVLRQTSYQRSRPVICALMILWKVA